MSCSKFVALDCLPLQTNKHKFSRITKVEITLFIEKTEIERERRYCIFRHKTKNKIKKNKSQKVAEEEEIY